MNNPILIYLTKSCNTLIVNQKKNYIKKYEITINKNHSL